MTLKLRGNAEKYKDKYYYHLHNVVTNDYGCGDIIRNTKKVLGVSNYINHTLKAYIGNTKIEYCVLRNMIDSDRFRTNNTSIEKKAVSFLYNSKCRQHVSQT